MSAPKNEVVQIEYQNPDAKHKLLIPTLVLCNTPDEDIERNIRQNSVNYTEWLKLQKEHDRIAVIIGGGPSINDQVEKIKWLQDAGATVFALNAASRWAKRHDIEVDFQVIADAKEETSILVDPEAHRHLFASQCNPKTFAKVENPVLWHLETGSVEQFFPPERVKKGGYVLIGGGASVGNSAMCVAYSQGFRELHLFGYDSCHKDKQSHAYPQPMNAFIPTMTVKWGGKEFLTSVAMKAQAEKFQLTAQALKQGGCELHLYGEGLLQTMYHTKPTDVTEQQKYQLMWQYDVYREISPGENIADFYLMLVSPDSLIVDYGCGTGRAGLKFRERGHDVLLVDFTDNCRDEEALSLPFLQWDLTQPCPAKSKYGFCTDVLEHIPPNGVDTVIQNIMHSSELVFFQISTVADALGATIDMPLHLTIQSPEWWQQKFVDLGYSVIWSEYLNIEGRYLVQHSTT